MAQEFSCCSVQGITALNVAVLKNWKAEHVKIHKTHYPEGARVYKLMRESLPAQLIYAVFV